jgi:hypothetical protein
MPILAEKPIIMAEKPFLAKKKAISDLKAIVAKI